MVVKLKIHDEKGNLKTVQDWTLKDKEEAINCLKGTVSLLAGTGLKFSVENEE